MPALYYTDEAAYPSLPGEVCVELSLLLPARQCEALERAADLQGLTVGELLRQLISGHLAGVNETWL